ncbi:MAG: hypothetical protein H7066_08420 [Cytophagaceae bacterium]|nr:hypothetical protein [Gemmatimonadaceae bacterium]
MTTVRVYVNGRGVDAPSTGNALDAVRLLDEALASALLSGARALTDSRGLPVPNDSPVHGGAIFRVVSGRLRETGTA